MQYLFLKSIINNMSLVNNPCSILVFRINPDNDELYWAVDNPFIKVFFIRMGDIGIIAHLMDNGFNKNFFMEQQSMRDLLTKTLYPIQFAELCAQFLYKSYLFYRDPFYTTVFDQDKNPQLILSHDLSGYGYKEWDQKEYAGILAFYLKKWGLSFVDLYRDDNKVMTYLRNEDGTFKDLSLYA